jgi:hypothetical protein
VLRPLSQGQANKESITYSSGAFDPKDDGTVATTPLMRKLANGRGIHRFEFDVIKLWEISLEELRTKGLIGLLPLLPLTRGGAKREVIEEAIGELAPTGEEPKAEVLALTYGIASLALENAADQEWLIRRFTKMYDILRETRAYKACILVVYSHRENMLPCLFL